MELWQAVNTDQADYLGIIEIETCDDVEVFGSCTNIGLLESGNYKIDHDFSIDENLQELIADLESYYSDGKGYQSANFTCNDRM